VALLPRFLSLGELGVLALLFTGLPADRRRHRRR
jgi:hypothetical protein